MARLSDDHREVLTLSRLQELKYHEIGQILGYYRSGCKNKSVQGHAGTEKYLYQNWTLKPEEMKCEQYEEKLIGLLNNELTPANGQNWKSIWLVVRLQRRICRTCNKFGR